MDYKELDVWVRTRKLVKKKYLLTKVFPDEERFGLTSQMRRCAVSVSSNVAEGCRRQTANDTINFSHLARGSLYALETPSVLTSDLEYIHLNQNKVLEDIERVKKLLNGFINYHRKLWVF